MSTLGVCSFGFLDVVFLFKFGLMLFVWFGHFSFRVFAPRLFPPRPSFLELRSMVPARFGRTASGFNILLQLGNSFSNTKLMI